MTTLRSHSHPVLRSQTLAGFVRCGTGTPSCRMRCHTIKPPIGPRTITAIVYFHDHFILGVIMITIAQKASQIIPCTEPVIALPAVLGTMSQKVNRIM